MADNLAERLFKTVMQSLGNAPAEIAAEITHQGRQGAHEIAAALFNESAFVMYPRGGRDDHSIQEPEHGLDNKGIEQPKMERDGMSM